MEKETPDRSSLTVMILALAVTLAAFGVFANSVGGEFVYDDTRQIVRNPLIQEPSLYGKALASDVWAFKGDGSIAASNYWRPVFTAWSIVNFQLFGLEPFGWHLSSIALHTVNCVLILLLLLRLGLTVPQSFAASLVFAVHPVHAESVAWIAGSPDLLFSLSFLGSIWFAKNYSETGHRFDVVIALILYALALGSKETALFCLPLYVLLFSGSAKNDGEQKFGALNAGLRLTFPFTLVAGLYFVLRWIVLGELARKPEGSVDALSAVLSVPAAFVFYLKQVFLPLELAVNYPLRPVESPDLANVAIPLAVSAAVVGVIVFLNRRFPSTRVGTALFLLPLIPVFNLTAFPAEQIVHDRFLYLPLLGILIIVAVAAQRLLSLVSKERAGAVLVIGAVVVSLPLALKTFEQNGSWKDELTLWERNVKVDPASAATNVQYGAALEANERYAEAVLAYNRSLDVEPNPLAYLGKARSNIRLGRFEEANWDLKTVTEMPPESVNAYTLYQAYEALALSYSSAERYAEAASALNEAIERLPIYRAALSAKLAVVLYQDDKKQEALAVLEGVRKNAVTELLPESKTAIFRLGALYAEMGRREDARAALEEYMRLTARIGDKGTLADRALAAETLKQLR